MTRGLYGWKPPSTATDYLKEQDLREAAQRAAVARDHRMQESRDWLADYHAHHRQTRFDWSGKFPATITQEQDDAEDIEAAYRQAAAHAAEVSIEEGVGDAAAECRGEAADDRQGRVFEGPGDGAAQSQRGPTDAERSDGAEECPSFTDTPF